MTDPQTKNENRLARKILLRGSTALLTVALAAAVTVTSGIVPEPVSKPAQAQNVSLSVQFRTALEPHGRWQRHGRWGEVWIPAKRDRDWRPYTAGRWEYTDRWGWYWVSDEDFGWVTYHYGRWVLTSEFGWVWIPGNEWGPAWVQWRRGDRHAGWAPLPPREVIYDYDDDPDFWIFVSFNNFTAPNIRRVILPPRERVVYIRETVIVNRTIIIDRDGDRDRRGRFAVNPGIEPRIVAARAGKPIRVSNVKPVVVAGTVGVESAVEVRAEEARKQPQRVRAQVSESKETVEPAKDVPPPQALKKGEEGRLGERPPEAAKGGKPVAASEADDRAKDGDAAKSKAEDSAKDKSADDDAAKARTKGDDAAKSKSGDDARSRAKSKADDDDDAKSRSKAADEVKSRTDDAKPKADEDSAKSRDTRRKSDDDGAKDAKSKAPEPKDEPKSRERDADKGKPESKQAAPKEAPEPRRAAPKEAAPKQAPEPRRAAPEPKQAPKQAPEPKAAPKAAPERKAPSAPKAPPPTPKRGGEREKGKEG